MSNSIGNCQQPIIYVQEGYPKTKSSLKRPAEHAATMACAGAAIATAFDILPNKAAFPTWGAKLKHIGRSAAIFATCSVVIDACYGVIRKIFD